MNPQEQFWSGTFGDEYTSRNRVAWEKRIPFWREILALTQARSVLDVGCNAGWNLRAIKAVDPAVEAMGVDINAAAVAEAEAAGVEAHLMAINQVGAVISGFDLVCTSGVLIHVAPADLPEAMRNIVQASNRWVLAVEYESETEEQIDYRGNSERLWKRPFGRLYEALGLRLHMYDAETFGFDQCATWLLEKP
jgi:pseudaminic acid biosynthesis-associated methylase